MELEHFIQCICNLSRLGSLFPKYGHQAGSVAIQLGIETVGQVLVSYPLVLSIHLYKRKEETKKKTEHKVQRGIALGEQGSSTCFFRHLTTFVNTCKKVVNTLFKKKGVY